MVAMSCHSTPAFGGVPNSPIFFFAKPDKSFGVLGDTSSRVKRPSDWNSDLDSIEVERSFPSPDRLSLDNSEEVKLSSQEIEALESTLELSFVFTDLEVSEVTVCSPQSLTVSGVLRACCSSRSVPLRELPGRPHHEFSHPGSLGECRLLPVGVGILQALLNCMSPLRVFYFFQGRCPPRVEFTILLFQAEAQLHAVTK